MMKKAILLLLIAISFQLKAQTLNEITLVDVLSEQGVSMSDFRNKEALVIVFMSAKCPYVKYYKQRINELSGKYGTQNVAVVLANANAAESIESMKAQAEEYNAPYLIDNDKRLANVLKASKSPEAFVVHDGEVVYSGAIDDNPQVAQGVNKAYLDEAIALFLKNQSKTESQRPLGCMIK